MSEEDRIRLSILTTRISEINKEIQRAHVERPDYYPETLINEIISISQQIIDVRRNI